MVIEWAAKSVGFCLALAVLADVLVAVVDARWSRRLASVGQWAERVLADRRVLAGGVALLAIFYVGSYLGHPSLPGQFGSPPERALGWWGWWDQGKYHASAAALSQGRVTPDDYWYPLGYPALGALFFTDAPGHPFFVPNLAISLSCGVLLWRLFRKVLDRRNATAVLALTLFLAHDELVRSFVIPWSTIPTALITYLALSLSLEAKPSARTCLWLSCLTGVCYLFRPGDSVILMPMVASTWFRLPDWNSRFKAAVVGSVVAIPFPIAVLVVNTLVFGDPRTPYDDAVAQAGFGDQSIAEKAYGFVVDGDIIWRAGGSSILDRMPWVIIAGPGIWLFVRELGVRTVGILTSTLVSLGLYLSFNDFTPAGLYTYNLIHYMAWLLPLACVASYRTVRDARKWVRSLGAWSTLLVPVSVVGGIELREVPLAAAVVGAEGTLAMEPTEVEGTPRILVTDKLVDASPTEYRVLENLQPVKRVQEMWVAISGDDRVVFTSYGPWKLGATVLGPPVMANQKVEIRGLEWGLSFPWTRQTRVRVLDARARGTADKVDLVGERDDPDGLYDVVIELESDPVIEDVTRWEVTSESGRWISWPGGAFWRVRLADRAARDELPSGWSSSKRYLILRANDSVHDRKDLQIRGFSSEGRTLVAATVEFDPGTPVADAPL